MHTLQIYQSKGYTIAINPAPAPQGRYYNAFSVHLHSPSTPLSQLAVVRQNGISTAATFATSEEAIESATTLAYEWIDQQPV